MAKIIRYCTLPHLLIRILPLDIFVAIENNLYPYRKEIILFFNTELNRSWYAMESKQQKLAGIPGR
jgi:hypothetical protein